MKFKINKNTVKEAVKCRNNFSCLNGDSDCLCSIDDCLNGNIHFIEPQAIDSSCEYKMSFGLAYTCNCPVRKELYNLFKV